MIALAHVENEHVLLNPFDCYCASEFRPPFYKGMGYFISCPIYLRFIFLEESLPKKNLYISCVLAVFQNGIEASSRQFDHITVLSMSNAFASLLMYCEPRHPFYAQIPPSSLQHMTSLVWKLEISKSVDREVDLSSSCSTLPLTRRDRC